MIRLNNDRSAVVNTDHRWLRIADHPPPESGKMLLIDKTSGVATCGTYDPAHGWTHWQGLPVFNPEKDV